MKKELVTVKCPTRDFSLIAFEIDPIGEDVDLVNAIRDEVLQHGAAAYAPSGRIRNEDELSKTRYLGILAENLLVAHLQDELGQGVHISNREFVDYDKHVDIEIQLGEKIVDLEVRSSFPYSRLQAVVCRIFKVIGPYSTSYKPGESVKDFYLLGLINEAVGRFNFNRKHTFYLAGGAPYQLLREKGKRDNLKQSGANYRVLRLVEAMDAVEIKDAIRSAINGV